MKDRLTALLGALLSLSLLYGLFAPQTGGRRITRPASTETGRSGYAALAQWLQAGGIATDSLRERMTVLGDMAPYAGSRGNILLTTLPHFYRPDADEIASLRAWVANGNTLLVMAAFNDTPEWSYQGDYESFHGVMAAITNMAFVAVENSDKPAGNNRFMPLPSARVDTLQTAARHWLMEGIDGLEGVSVLPASVYEPDLPDSPFFYELAWRKQDGRGVLWLRSLGQGQMIISSYASLFANDSIGRGDNRRLLANLVHYYLAPRGRFIFDDMHQGLTTLYDPRAFFADPRLHRTIYLLLALWLVYVVFSAGRLGPPRDPIAPRNSADFVRASGRFLARKVSAHDLAGRMFEIFFSEMRQRLHLPENGPPPWEALRASPRMPASALGVLVVAYRDWQAGRQIDLAKLQINMSMATDAFR